MTSGPLRLRVTAEPSHLAIARAFIGSSLHALEQPDTSVTDLRLAISELLTLMVLDQQALIDLELSFDDDWLVISITGSASLPTIPDDIAEMVGRLTDGGLEIQSEGWMIRMTRQ